MSSANAAKKAARRQTGAMVWLKEGHSTGNLP